MRAADAGLALLSHTPLLEKLRARLPDTPLTDLRFRWGEVYSETGQWARATGSAPAARSPLARPCRRW